jgi:hypothetical protein
LRGIAVVGDAPHRRAIRGRPLAHLKPEEEQPINVKAIA